MWNQPKIGGYSITISSLCVLGLNNAINISNNMQLSYVGSANHKSIVNFGGYMLL